MCRPSPTNTTPSSVSSSSSNLIVIGLEVEFGDRERKGPSSVFWWIESVFLVVFIVEFILRMRLHRFRLVPSEERQVGTTFADMSEIVESVDNHYKGDSPVLKKICWLW